MVQRRVRPTTAVVTAWAVLALASGCGGTLEGKYRRGELTTTTTGATRAPATNGTSPTTTTTTTTTVPTSGNAAGRAGRGESGGVEPGGTIVGRAAWRAVVPPSGGRHR